MIVYRELSSLETDLGLTARQLYSLSNALSRHYHKASIPKGNGDARTLRVPDEELKNAQRRILNRLLVYETVSPYASAYRYGGSTVRNASPHVGKPVLLKLDIRHFFDNLIYPVVKEKVFPADRYSEKLRILLSILCTYDGVLPQGAPTSPMITNIIMRDFDNRVGKWCSERGVSYTRYSDDMTFSGDFAPGPVIDLVRAELRVFGLYLNDEKTAVVRSGKRQTVTGIVVNHRIGIPSEYRRRIRQEMHYCMKFGIESHLERSGESLGREEYLNKLQGQVNYVLSVSSSDEFQEYKAWIIAQRKQAGTLPGGSA